MSQSPTDPTTTLTSRRPVASTRQSPSPRTSIASMTSPPSTAAPSTGILRISTKPRRASGSSVEFRVPPEQQLQAEPVSPQPSVDRLSVSFAADTPAGGGSASSPGGSGSESVPQTSPVADTPRSFGKPSPACIMGVSGTGRQRPPPLTLNGTDYKSRLSAEASDLGEEDDYSASMSAIIQRRASTRRLSKRRRPSSPFSPGVHIGVAEGEVTGKVSDGIAFTAVAGTPSAVPGAAEMATPFPTRRKSSVFTTSSAETTGSADTDSQEQIMENLRLHKEVLWGVKQQPWEMKKKLKLVRQAKTYVKRHEGQLQQRKATRDVLARFNLFLLKKWQRSRREFANLLNVLVPWEGRIKEIESHFGSVVASYFTFLRWLCWVNFVITVATALCIIVPEVLTADPNTGGERKEMLPEEKKTATHLSTLLDFGGVLKYSPIFYGYYTNRDGQRGYRLPFAYFMTGIALYVYSFVAILRKMAANSRMSKLSEKEDECVFTWKLFTGWDYMIGNAETAHNKAASTILGFKEALLEEAEKQREKRNWKILAVRFLVNLSVMFLLGLSAFAVVFAVKRSTEKDAESNLWRRNETTVIINIVNFVFPWLFEMLGKLERYHPRKTLRVQLARIMLLNLLNLYTFIFSTFSKITDMTRKLDEIRAASCSGKAVQIPCTLASLTTIAAVAIAVTSPTSWANGSTTDHQHVTNQIEWNRTWSPGSSPLPLTAIISKDITSLPRTFTSAENITSSIVTTPTLNGSPSTLTVLPSVSLPTTKSSNKVSSMTQSPTAQLTTLDFMDQSRMTESHTTQSLTTESPTTQSLTTESPTTQSLTTESPSTQSLTTESPTTQSLTTESPTTQSPVYESVPTQFPTEESSPMEESLDESSDSNEILNNDMSLIRLYKRNLEDIDFINYSIEDNATVVSRESILSTNSDDNSISVSTDDDNNTSTSVVPPVPDISSLTEIPSMSTTSDSTVSTTSSVKSTTTLRIVMTKGPPAISPVYTTDTLPSTVSTPGDDNRVSANFISSTNSPELSTLPTLSTTADQLKRPGTSLDTSSILGERFCFSECASEEKDEYAKRTSRFDLPTRRKLVNLCWETMFGQELVKMTVMDLVMTILTTLSMDFFLAVFIRVMNNCWCWDLEKKFPKYGDFKIAENILHLVNNQGMVWMGMFFSPGLAAINLVKLAVMMYVRSWAVLTCNVPHEVVFKASRSNNFYLALLLTMLFLCVLPVGYAVVWLTPSWHCGPFSNYPRIYLIFTETLRKLVPKSLHFLLDYIASPSVVIPLLLLLSLVIYYLVSLTNSLREATNDLKVQLRRERTEERRRMFQLVERRRRGGTGSTDLADKWRRLLPALPSAKDEESTNDPASGGTRPENAARRKELLTRLLKHALRKSSATSDEESGVGAVDPEVDGDGTDAEQPDSLPEDGPTKPAPTAVVTPRPGRVPLSHTVESIRRGGRLKQSQPSPTTQQPPPAPQQPPPPHAVTSPTTSSHREREDSVASAWSDNIPEIRISKTESTDCVVDIDDDDDKKPTTTGSSDTVVAAFDLAETQKQEKKKAVGRAILQEARRTREDSTKPATP